LIARKDICEVEGLFNFLLLIHKYYKNPEDLKVAERH